MRALTILSGNKIKELEAEAVCRILLRAASILLEKKESISPGFDTCFGANYSRVMKWMCKIRIIYHEMDFLSISTLEAWLKYTIRKIARKYDVETETVSIDNIRAETQVTEYLFDKGHRNMVVVAGKKNASVNAERLASVCQVYHDRGMALPGENVLYCNFGEDIAYQQVRAWLESNPGNSCTAFICFLDLMAFAV